MINYILFVLLMSSLIQLSCSIEVITNNPGSVSLQNGANRCQGLVKLQNPSVTNALLQACNSDAGDNEIKVICRQLNCNTENARRVSSTEFDFSGAAYFTFFNYSCSGDEASLSACVSLGSVNCATSESRSALAANCGGESGESNQNERTGSKLIIIIACSILGVLLVCVAAVDIIVILCCARKRNRESGMDLYIY